MARSTRPRKGATKRATKAAASRRRQAGPTPWWGDGPPPHERWPGVTIPLPAVWHRGRKRWESPDGRYYFDADAADRACDFFPALLRHHIGEFAGQPFELMDYQRQLLTRPIFGWKRASDGLRRFRQLFAFIPKGAGKSPWAAGSGLYLLLCDNEPAAEVYALAADKHQARVVHSNAKIMVEESPDLAERCDVLRDSIYHPVSRSAYLVLSSDAKTKHGFRPHAAIFDEFHAQPNRDLYEAMKKSMAKRRQPLMVLITHAGDDDEGICYEEYEYSKRVLSGTVPDETRLPVIFEASEKDDWTSPAVWARVNPGHGVTVKPDAIAAECYEAQIEPRKKNDFLRFHLNRWVSQAVAWLELDWWDACKVDALDYELLATLPCAAGLDMAQKIDLAAFVVTIRRPLQQADGAPPVVQVVTETDEGEVVTVHRSLNFAVTLVPFFWIPEATMRKREKEDGVPYTLWSQPRGGNGPFAHMGIVTATEGAMIDYDRVYEDIATRIAPVFPRLKGSEIGYDPAFADDVALRLGNANFTTVEVLQNYYKHLSGPCHLFEGLLQAARVEHDGNRCLRWHAENVAVKRDDAGRLRPVKPRNDRKRIDGIVASLMGLKMLENQPETIEESGGFEGSAGVIVRSDGVYDAVTGDRIV